VGGPLFAFSHSLVGRTIFPYLDATGGLWRPAGVLANHWCMQVKPLCILAMIDTGQLDWKLVAITVDDPKAAELQNADDIEL